MSEIASPAVVIGRRADGRFGAGNSFGTGNPHRHAIQRCRSALYQTVTKEDIAEIVRSMIERAKQGDVPSAKLVLSYTVGAPERMETDVESGENDPNSKAEVLDLLQKYVPRGLLMSLVKESSANDSGNG